MNHHALAVSHLTVMYQQTVALLDMTASVPAGAMAAIVGPNGAGKTTFIKAALDLLKPLAGSITFFGMPYQQYRKHLAYVPQTSSVDWDFPALVIEVVMMGAYQRLGLFQRPGKHEQRQAMQALEAVDLVAYAHRPIGQLSGGQQQRVFLARALMQQADVYILDEPFAGIDAPTERLIVTVLHRLQQEGKTIIAVHHDVQTLNEYFDWVIFINTRCVAYGPVRDIVTPAILQATYGKVPTHIFYPPRQHYETPHG